jgi:hypothetical protein
MNDAAAAAVNLLLPSCMLLPSQLLLIYNCYILYTSQFTAFVLVPPRTLTSLSSSGP